MDDELAETMQMKGARTVSRLLEDLTLLGLERDVLYDARDLLFVSVAKICLGIVAKDIEPDERKEFFEDLFRDILDDITKFEALPEAKFGKALEELFRKLQEDVDDGE